MNLGGFGMLNIAVENVRMNLSMLTDGNALTPTMKSGEFLIGGTRIPFVLQKRLYGKFFVGQEFSKVGVQIFHQRKTLFTKKGYVSVFLSLDSNAQVKAYFKKKDVKIFLATLCNVAVDKIIH